MTHIQSINQVLFLVPRSALMVSQSCLSVALRLTLRWIFNMGHSFMLYIHHKRPDRVVLDVLGGRERREALPLLSPEDNHDRLIIPQTLANDGPTI